MTNWCSNRFYAAGEPEAVEEFRILNAQFSGPWNAKLGSHSLEEDGPSRHRMGHRPRGDLSFGALQPAGDWGTSDDLGGHCFEFKPLDAGRWKVGPTETMGRLLVWGFDTAWKPPEKWLRQVGERFPDLRLYLGHEEPGSGSSGLLGTIDGRFWRSPSSRWPNTEPPASGHPHDQARADARRVLPPHRRPNALLRAVWSDSVEAVDRDLRRHGLRGVTSDCKEGRWGPLLHAARAGSARVFARLIEAGADPRGGVDRESKRSFGLLDVLLDVYPHQDPALVDARMDMLSVALQAAPDLARKPLGCGALPAEVAARYDIGPALEALLPLHDLSAQGSHGSLLDVALAHMDRAASLRALVEGVPETWRDTVANQVARRLVRRATERDVPEHAKLFAELERSHRLEPRVCDQAAGHVPVKVFGNEQKVRPAFFLFVNASRALRAVEAIAPASVTPLP